MLRVLGYWLLYTFVGTLVVVMLLAGGGDLGSEDARSPIRPRTKMIGASFGIVLAATLVGAYLMRNATARPPWLVPAVAGAGALALVLGIWSWVRIARDLARRRR